MESKKSEALRSINLAKAALESNDKERAFKLINMAKRLDSSLSLDELLTAFKNLDKFKYQSGDGGVREVPTCSNESELPHCGRNYTEENVKLITDIKRCNDYYGILGVEKNCSIEEIRKAYKKLSLKLHPDKNKAPGADGAFKIICKAFKCLSEEETRRKYDQIGFVEGHEYEQQFGHVRRRGRTARSEFCGTQGDEFQAQQAYRAREMAGRQREHNVQAGGFDWFVVLNMLNEMWPIFVILFFVFASLPFKEPIYSLQQTHTYHILKVTEKHGIEYYVKLADFDEKFPAASSERNKIENDVLWDYKSLLGRYCHLEMRIQQRKRDYPTLHCNMLRCFIAFEIILAKVELIHPSLKAKGSLVHISGRVSFRILLLETGEILNFVW